MAENNLGQVNLQIEDLNVTYIDKEDPDYKRYLEKAEKSEEFKAVKVALKENGIMLDSNSAVVRKVEVGKSKDMQDKVPRILQIVYPNMIKGENSGETFYTEGTADKIIYAVNNTGKDSYEVTYYEQGNVESMKIENDEVVESTKQLNPPTTYAITCEGVCGVICTGGFGTQISGCISECRLTGPGALYCSGLCTIIVGLGCLVGCDRICSLF
ncbi:hypothetical protein ABRT01_17530 [Lentibacillus sp. L22]|uniref:hypothetical protein n=1 Tax=Lentibacillus sp. L22 TaxID=3163028 RepID=UPI0034679A35